VSLLSDGKEMRKTDKGQDYYKGMSSYAQAHACLNIVSKTLRYVYQRGSFLVKI